MRVIVSDKSHNKNAEVSERKIISATSSFGILRKELVNNIGKERVGSFLFQFGWEMGKKDALEALKTGEPLEELVKIGPKLHIDSGQIQGVDHTCNIIYEDDNSVKTLKGTGIWIESYEAQEHLNILGVSDVPVCSTLSGYSSGFMTTIFNKNLIAQEISCVGAGDKECRWELKPQEEWESEAHGGIHILNRTPIIKELKYTYDQMVEQTNVITQLAEFQKLLTQEVVKGSDLQSLAELAFQRLEYPVIIEDLNFQSVVYAGINDDEILYYKKDLQESNLYKKLDLTAFPSVTTKRLSFENYERLMVPVIVKNNVLGYCSFILEGQANKVKEETSLLLDHLAHAAALILLNEKTVFESFERMKGNFLEQILTKEIASSELLRKSQYMGLKLNKPFYIATVSHDFESSGLEEEFMHYEKLLETTYQFFNNQEAYVLAGHLEGKITLLITDYSNINIEKTIGKFYSYLAKRLPGVLFKIGISKEGTDIKRAARHHEESQIALRLAIRKKIVSFHSLGIMGSLIHSENIQAIDVIAREELKELYDTKDEKMLELFRTLYFFLINGGNLRNTMEDMALSMSGLRHRVDKLEEILAKDLRDPEEAFQLLLILKSVIILRELDIT
jgi:sugar diacid utilization regulator/predicted hydrocarbon binding protein